MINNKFERKQLVLFIFKIDGNSIFFIMKKSNKLTYARKQLTLEEIITKIQSIQIKQQILLLKRFYIFKKPPQIIFNKKNNDSIEQFGRTFYIIMILKLVKKFQDQQTFRLKKINELKSLYIDLFNSMKSKSFLIEYYMFLLSLSVQNIIQKVISPFATEKSMQQISYITIIYETLGILMSETTFNVLKKKYIKSKNYAQSQNDLLSLLDIIKMATQKQCNISDSDRFLNNIKETLRLPTNKKTIQQNRIDTQQSIQISKKLLDRKYREIFMRSHQVSTSLSQSVTHRIQANNWKQNFNIKTNPIHSSKTYKFKTYTPVEFNDKSNHKIKFRSRKKKTMNNNSCGKPPTNQWINIVRNLKTQMASRYSLESLSNSSCLRQNKTAQHFQRSQQSNQKQNKYHQFDVEATKHRQFRSEVPLFFNQQEPKVDRIQMGLITKIQNYPQFKKQYKAKPMFKNSLKKDFIQFKNDCDTRQYNYKEQTISDTLSNEIPYLRRKIYRK